MVICIAGKNDIAVNGLKYLIDNFSNHELVACTNKSDDAVNGWQKSFKYFCIKHNIKQLKIEELYEIENLIMISLEFDQIIRPAKFKSAKLFNLHFSKLPAYKGMFTSVLPLLNGELESAVTLHEIDKGIDTGRIIDQYVFPLSLDMTARQLYDLFNCNAINLFKININRIVNRNYESFPQPALGSTYHSRHFLDFSNIIIDLHSTAFQVHNQLRAFTFRDFQLPKVDGVTIYKSEILESVSTGKPGSLINRDQYKMVVNTIDYDIALYIDQEDELKRIGTEGDVSKYLELKNNFPVDIRTKEGWNLLIIASYHNQFRLVKQLVDEDWDVDAANYKGTTALMYAMTSASSGKGMQSLEILSNAGADFQKLDDYERDVFSYANQYGNQQVIEFLNTLKHHHN